MMNKSVGGVTGSWVKWSTISILGFVAIAGLVLIVLPTSKPPREEKVIENFNTNRPAYERLRVLLADDQLLRVAEWGVETDSPMGIHHPREGGFSVDRYHEYLSLVKEVGAIGASRGRRGEHPLRCLRSRVGSRLGGRH